MRIPPSVFVMSVVVAVPFGLAIKQTVKHEDLAGRMEREEEDMRVSAERERIESEQRQAAEKALEAAEKKRHDELLMNLFGDTPAAMGPQLKDVKLGAQPTPGVVDELMASDLAITVARQPTGEIYAVSSRLGSSFDRDDGSTGCTIARDRLEKKWGESKGGVWLDAATHTRLAIKDSPCEIEFDRYVEVADWVKQLPLDYVGKKLSDVKELGIDTAGETSWYLPGVAAGDTSTMVSIASSEKNRVIGLTITTQLPWEERDAVLAALTKKYGKPGVDLDLPDTYTWKSKQLTMSYEGTRVEMVIGKLSEEP